MSTGADRIRIRFAPGPSKAVALDVKVEAIQTLDDGTEKVTDISSFCRAADIRLHVGDVATAKLEVFVSEVEVESLVSEFKTLEIKKAKKTPWWWRVRKPMVDVTRFNSTGCREYLPGSGIKGA